MEERERVYTYTVTPTTTTGTGLQSTAPGTFTTGTGLQSTAPGGFTSGSGFQSTPGTFVYTVPPSESISSSSRIHPTELAAGPSVHPTEHMASQIRPTETLETATRLHSAEGLTAGAAPPTEAMSALRFESREVPIQQQQYYQTSEIRPTTITTIPATVITSTSNMPVSGAAHVVPMVPVESHQVPYGAESRLERESFRTVEVLPTTTSNISSIPTTPVPATTTVGETSLPATSLGTTTYTTTGTGTGLPLATGPATTTAVAHEEKKGGFFSHLFHHGHHAATPATATTGAGMRDPLTEQAERFIDNLAKHPRELSYYEQFVVQYNRGMRFTPMQARRLVEVLIKNSAARGQTVPYYSVYALELLLKLAIADPIVHNELARIDDQQLSLLRMDKYIRNDETKPLGLNFMLYFYRFLGRTRYQDWVVSKKPEKDRMWHSEIENYIASQQSMEIAMFLEGISRRLPPLLPHAPIGEHLLTTTITEVKPVTTIYESKPIATSTITEIVREVPISSQTTTLNTSGTSTTYKPAY